MSLRKGLSVLDVGCGVGNLTRLFLDQVKPGGRVVGVDLSQTMIRQARKRASKSGSSLVFKEGSVYRLHFDDGVFDRTVATTLFEHLSTPLVALREMIRVTRPGGQVIVTDFDWDTHIVSTGDLQLDRKLVRLFSSDIPAPNVGRQLPLMFHQSGLKEIRVTPQTVVVRGPGEQGLLPVLTLFLQSAVKRARLTPAEAKRTKCAITRALRLRTYFESFSLFHVNGRKR